MPEGVLLRAALPGENERTTIEERIKQFQQISKNHGFKRAQGPKDFYDKESEKFLSTPVTQFIQDIDTACELAGVTREDQKARGWFNYTGEAKKTAYERVSRAFHYLLSLGYNWRDIAA